MAVKAPKPKKQKRASGGHPAVTLSVPAVPASVQAEMEQQYRALREAEATPQPQSFPGYDPLRTPTYVAEETFNAQIRAGAFQQQYTVQGAPPVLTPPQYDIVDDDDEAEEEDDEEDEYDGEDETSASEDDEEADEDDAEDADDAEDDAEDFIAGDQDLDLNVVDQYPAGPITVGGNAPRPPLAQPLPVKLSPWVPVGEARNEDGSPKYPELVGKGYFLRAYTDLALEFLEQAEALQDAVRRAKRESRLQGRDVQPRIKVTSIIAVLRNIVADYNYVDEYGRALPPAPSGLYKIRKLDLLAATLEAAMAAVVPTNRRSDRSKKHSSPSRATRRRRR